MIYYCYYQYNEDDFFISIMNEINAILSFFPLDSSTKKLSLIFLFCNFSVFISSVVSFFLWIFHMHFGCLSLTWVRDAHTHTSMVAIWIICFVITIVVFIVGRHWLLAHKKHTQIFALLHGPRILSVFRFEAGLIFLSQRQSKKKTRRKNRKISQNCGKFHCVFERFANLRFKSRKN